MTTTSRPSVLDLCEGPLATSMALIPAVRQLGFALDAKLAAAYDAGANDVTFTDEQLSEVRVDDTPLSADLMTKLLPGSFVRREQHLGTSSTGGDTVPVLMTVYHFDLALLRTATPGKVANRTAPPQPIRRAHSFERSRGRYRYG